MILLGNVPKYVSKPFILEIEQIGGTVELRSHEEGKVNG